MYVPNPTTAIRTLLRSDAQGNPTKKQWLIGGGILVAALLMRR